MRSPRLYVFLAIILSLAFLSFVKSLPFEAISQDDADKIVVVNKTKAFQVIEAKRVDNKLNISLKNNYVRRITAFVIRIGKNFRITEELISSEVSDEIGIKSQETVHRTFPIPSDVQYEPFLQITLHSIVLDDNTGDGDPVIFEDIRDARLGQAVQMRRALKLLDKYIPLGDSPVNTWQLKQDLEAALDGPETETLALLRDQHPLGVINRHGTDSLSDFVKDGLARGKSDALRRLMEAEQSSSPRDSLLKMKASYQKILKRL